MIKEYIAQGDTVEEAIESGCKALGVDSFDVTTEILELPKKGFFGKIKSAAKVKIIYDDGNDEPNESVEKKQNKEVKTEQAKPEIEETLKKEEDIPEQEEEKKEVFVGDKEKKIEIARNYITDILSNMGIENINLDIKEKEDGAVVTLTGDNLGVVIGRRGETLDAIQYLVSLACNRIDSGYYRITIDCGDFRSKREKTLIELAEKIASTVLKTGRSTTLEPMNPYERRIIHAVIASKEGVTSRSVGEEPYRKVIISPKGGARHQKGGNRSADRRGRNRHSGRKNNQVLKERPQPKKEEPREKLNDDFGDSLYSKIEL